MAARAHVRHRFTEYKDELDEIPLEACEEDDLYREVRDAANGAVDDLLEKHGQ